jgi:hypothetical protein
VRRSTAYLVVPVLLVLGASLGPSGGRAARAQQPPWVPPETLVNRGRLCQAPGVVCNPAPATSGSRPAVQDPAATEASRLEAERLQQGKSACERQWGNLEAMVRHCEEQARRGGGAAGPSSTPAR